MRHRHLGLAATLALLVAAPAHAVGGLGNFTPIAERVDAVYRLIFWITLAIFIGVWLALAYVVIRFRYRPGREAQQIHGNLWLEIIWTVVPTLALIVIAIPTYRTLRFVEDAPPASLVVEIVAHQFYWEYRYPDQHLVLSGEPLVVPAHRVIRVLVSSADVVHDWWVPEFGFKLDAIPGHINQGWLEVNKPGTYQGYCAMLCGTLHAQMLTQVQALPPAEFDAWLKAKVREASATPSAAPEEATP